MYEVFKERNNPEQIQKVSYTDFNNIKNEDIKLLFVECGGYSFRNGLYRVHTPNTSLYWSDLISNYYLKYKGKIIPFGYDWLGRQYALDISRKNYLLMFDPSTAEDFELNQSLTSFHNQDLVNEREDILSEQLFSVVTKTLGVTKISYEDCIGYKVPLFLNGSDTVNNYEVSNIDVYWEIQCQIYLQIKDLPPGTKINSVKFE